MRAIVNRNFIPSTVVLAALASSWIADSLTAQERLTVYVWEFSTRDRKMNRVTSNFTEAFETALVQRGGLRVLQRRNLDLLKEQRASEAKVSAKGLDADSLDKLSIAGAEAVVFGEVYDDVEGGEYLITATLERLDSEILARASVYLRRPLADDPRSRREAMADLADQLAQGLLARHKPPEPEPKMPVSVANALELAQNQRCTEAKADLQTAARVERGNAEVHYWLGRCLMEEADHRGAFDALTSAIAINDGNPEYYLYRGLANARMERDAYAIEDLSEAIAIDPNTARYYKERGNLFVQQRDFRRATFDFRKATQIDSSDAEAYELLGNALIKNGDKMLGEQYLAKAASLR